MILKIIGQRVTYIDTSKGEIKQPESFTIGQVIDFANRKEVTICEVIVPTWNIEMRYKKGSVVLTPRFKNWVLVNTRPATGYTSYEEAWQNMLEMAEIDGNLMYRVVEA